MALMALTLARTGRFAGQYQIWDATVSRAVFTVLPVSESPSIIVSFLSRNVLEIAEKKAAQMHADPDRQTEAAQYQPSESEDKDRGLMIRIALGLGLAYVGFLACWIWATRLRSRPPRH